MSHITQQIEENKAELSVFWDNIAKNLPKSLERAALGDTKIFAAFSAAYPKMKAYLTIKLLEAVLEEVGGDIEGNAEIFSEKQEDEILSQNYERQRIRTLLTEAIEQTKKQTI